MSGVIGGGAWQGAVAAVVCVCVCVCSVFAGLMKEQNDGIGGDGFAASDGANFFAGFGFDVDLCGRDLEEAGELVADQRFPGREFGLFGVDGAVEVKDMPVAALEGMENGLEQGCGVGVEEGGVGIGEPFADISECGSAEECIDDGVKEYVGIAVAIESERGIGDIDTAEDEGAVGDGAVCIVSFADAEVWGLWHGLEFRVAGSGVLVDGWRIAKGKACENLWFGRQKLLIFVMGDSGVGWVVFEFAMEQENCLCSICGGVQN